MIQALVNDCNSHLSSMEISRQTLEGAVAQGENDDELRAKSAELAKHLADYKNAAKHCRKHCAPQSSQRARLLQPRRQHLELPRFDSWNAVLRAKGAMAGHGKTAKFQPVLMDEHLQFDLQLLTFLEDCQPAMRRLGELLGFCEPHAVALEAQQCIYTNCNIK